MKSIKRILVLLIIFLICANTFALAGSIDPEDYRPGDISPADRQKVGEITGNILANIRTIGIVLSVIILIIIGIKYIVGSVEEKANYKEKAIPYIIGVFLLAATTILPDLIWNTVH